MNVSIYFIYIYVVLILWLLFQLKYCLCEVYLITHYKISHFYRRKYFVGVWLEVRRWFIYRHIHQRITSIGFPFVGNSPFHHYIGWTNKKNHLLMVLQMKFARQKKSFLLEIYRWIFIPSVISWFTDGYVPSEHFSVSVWNTDWIYPSINSSVSVAATVKCRRIKSVGKAVGECLKYRPNIFICKCVSECYYQMPTNSFRR